MKRLGIGIAIASATLLSACGGDSDDAVTPGTGATSAPADASSDEPSEATSDDTSEGASTVLTAMVGTAEDPDAFVIMLMDDAGEMVTTLPAGDYTIEVSDPTSMHNFHLTGGGVDETTTVDGITETSWDVTLEPGDYSYVCDPHPNMTGAFTVT